jgi:branched-chain amino acid transport system ATP-binding protein
MTPTEKAQMIELIKKVHKEGLTILMVEHDMRSVMELCEYISVLNFGTLLVEGLPEEIQNNEDVINAYLGTDELTCLWGEEVAT